MAAAMQPVGKCWPGDTGAAYGDVHTIVLLIDHANSKRKYPLPAEFRCTSILFVITPFSPEPEGGTKARD